ncbi:hypothetical protein HMN09_01016800 [Mycena chlorophos]|uniref:F-box domain-containing protein n=1 Tax=Mycena chlorophos TaxID=658473 RepID=A0A8H6VXR8_MYCCL|nr:hypothetical protein HMN09_01016800 [Mycena chlorophos]
MSSSKTNKYELPTELLLFIAAFSSRQSLGRLCCVSRRFCSVFVYPLHENILDLDARQSLLLASTLRDANPPSWRPHPAELIRTLMLTDADGDVQWFALEGKRTIENLFRCVPGGGGSPLRTLHWSVSSFMDDLGRLLLTPGNFPHLKELFVKSYGMNRNFLFIHKGGLDTFSLDLTVNLDDDDESALIHKLGESMLLLPITSPALRSLRLGLDLWYDDDLQFHGSDDFVNAINSLHFPCLEKLDLHVTFTSSNDTSEYGDAGDSMDYTPFLAAHPQLVDLSLWVIGTDPVEYHPLFSNLRSFKGDSQDIGSLLKHQPQNLDTLVIVLLHDNYYSTDLSTLPTHTLLTKLTVAAKQGDDSVLKKPNEVSPETFTALVSSFPNLQHLDICISDTMSNYLTDLIRLTKLETLRVHEYRRKKIPPNQLLAKAFPSARYAHPISKHLVPALPRLASVEVHLLIDNLDLLHHSDALYCVCDECERDRENEFILVAAEIEITYRFAVVRRRPTSGEVPPPWVILEWSDFRDSDERLSSGLYNNKLTPWSDT